MRILVLEDSQAVARLVVSGLKAEGFTVTLATTLAQAHDLLGTWESSNTTVATVNRAGVLEALTEGVTELTFTSDGVASTPWEVTVFGP